MTAIILGLAGSLHCVGMCSPLVMAVTSLSKKAFRDKIIYNGGRILTYSLLGAVVTFFGVIINFSGFQFLLTLSIAIMLIIMGLSGISGMRIPYLTPALIKFTTQVKGWFSIYLKKKTISGMFMMGMINGLLPCGLTYFAMTYCLTLARPVDGFQFMVLFGVGTLPAMIGLTGALSFFVRRFNLNLAMITRYSYIIIGVIVLARLYFSQNHLISQATEQLIILCR